MPQQSNIPVPSLSKTIIIGKQLCALQSVALIVLIIGMSTGRATAQTRELPPDPYRFIQWIGGDAKALARGVVSPYPLYAVAGIGGVVLLSSGQDPNMTQGAIDLAEGLDPNIRRILNEVGNAKVVRPMALILFLGSLTSRSRRFQDAAFTSLEAIFVSNLLTNTLKSVVGRSRPNEGEGARKFDPFSGNRSFPSGHATTVFAFTTPWLLYYRNAPTIALFVLGIGTAFTRMADNQHWFSDVLVGSAIGFTTALFFTRRHQRATGNVSVTPVVSAEQAGLFVRVKL